MEAGEGIAGRDLRGWAEGGPRPGPPLGGCWLKRTSVCGPRVQPLSRLGPPVPTGQGAGALRHNRPRNLWGLVQNENAGPLVQKRTECQDGNISMKPSVGLRVTVQVTCP